MWWCEQRTEEEAAEENKRPLGTEAPEAQAHVEKKNVIMNLIHIIASYFYKRWKNSDLCFIFFYCKNGGETDLEGIQVPI